MTFFDDVPRPPPPEPPNFRLPVWMGAPENIVPGVVPLELIVARTDDMAVVLTEVRAFPTGFETRLIILFRTDYDDERAEIDASEIIAAAARAVELWPDDRNAPPGPGSTWRVLQ
jgi:hypothetical protein